MVALRLSIGLLCSTLLVPLFVISSSSKDPYDEYHDYLGDMYQLVIDAKRDASFQAVIPSLLSLTLNSALFVLSSFQVHETLDHSSAKWNKLDNIEKTQNDLNQKVRNIFSKFLFREKDYDNWPPLVSYKGTFKDRTERKRMQDKCTPYLEKSSYSFQNFEWKDHHTYRLTHLDACAPHGRTMYAAVSLAKLTLDYTTTMFCRTLLNLPFMPNFIGIIANSVLFMRSWYQTEEKYLSKPSSGKSNVNEKDSPPANESSTALARVLATRQFNKTKEIILTDPSHKNLVAKVYALYVDIFKVSNEKTLVVSFNGKADKGKKWYYIQSDQIDYGTYLFEDNDKKAIFVGSYDEQKRIDSGILDDCEDQVETQIFEFRKRNEKIFLDHKARSITEELRNCLKGKGQKVKAILVVMELDDYGHHEYEGTTANEENRGMLRRRKIKTRWQNGRDPMYSVMHYVVLPL